MGKEQLYIIRQDREKAEKLQIWNKSAFSNRLKKKRKEKENDLEIHHHKKMKKKKKLSHILRFFFFEGVSYFSPKCGEETNLRIIDGNTFKIEMTSESS